MDKSISVYLVECIRMNYLIIMREVSGQAAILPLPSKAKEVMVMSSCNHCIAFHFFSKLTLELAKGV